MLSNDNDSKRRITELCMQKAKNLPTQWESGEEVFLWWIEDKNVAGQREFKVAENGQLMW